MLAYLTDMLHFNIALDRAQLDHCAVLDQMTCIFAWELQACFCHCYFQDIFTPDFSRKTPGFMRCKFMRSSCINLSCVLASIWDEKVTRLRCSTLKDLTGSVQGARSMMVGVRNRGQDLIIHGIHSGRK